ncbi:MAG: hypothetical protein V1745_04235 [Patescibacteria group bacterium]
MRTFNWNRMPESETIGRIDASRRPRRQPSRPSLPQPQRAFLATPEELEEQGFLLSAPVCRRDATYAVTVGTFCASGYDEPFSAEVPILDDPTDDDLEARRLSEERQRELNEASWRNFRQYALMGSRPPQQPRRPQDRRETIRPIAA